MFGVVMASLRLPKWFVVLVKGIGMGSADIVPGVSGGTVALITGIYDRLVEALRSIDFLFVLYFLRGFLDKSYFSRAKKDFLGIDWALLLPLGAGVGIAFLSLANVIDFLLESVPAYTYGFFFGLIVASAVLVWRSSKLPVGIVSIVSVFVGFVLSFLIVGLSAVTADHSVLVVFGAGVVSFCAMILPGLSGAFMLLLLGQYEFLLGVLSGFTHGDFSGVVFGFSYVLGGLLGLVVFSRVLSYVLKHYRVASLCFVIGLMLGALRKPAFEMAGSSDMVGVAVSVVVGVVLVGVLSYAESLVKVEVVS